MDIKTKTLDVLSKSIDIEKTEDFIDLKLHELGISSMDFFKIMIPLSKNLGIRLQELDPAKVSVNMTPNELISYLKNKKL